MNDLVIKRQNDGPIQDGPAGTEEEAPVQEDRTQLLPDGELTVVELESLDLEVEPPDSTAIHPRSHAASTRGTSVSSSGTASHSMAPVPVGTMLKSRFKLVASVGRGGMGRVYKAVDLRRVEARSQERARGRQAADRQVP